MENNNYIENGRAALGIELGSTRIKAVLIGADHSPIASGDFGWENRLEDGIWTYGMDEAWRGIREAYANLTNDVKTRYGAKLTRLGALGISGMMHGYLPFDDKMNQLAAFRTWRNTTTARAAAELSEKLDFNIPQRWSAAHLYQAILNGEAHVGKIAHLHTLATYIHFMLTGKNVVGIGEASGMFPISGDARDFDAARAEIFDGLLKEKGINLSVRKVFPKVLCAGEDAGSLTEAGALLLDPSGELRPGAPMCPPEGDAGTGMAATNSVSARTGNVSAGTSVFAMAVLEKPLSEAHPEIDMVTTPSGAPVAMVHCNTCTSDMNAWVSLLSEMAEAAGAKLGKNEIFTLLFNKALEGEPDCGGIVSYNCFTGEPVIGLEDGCPLIARRPDTAMNLSNFMRAQLYAAMATLKMGMDILVKRENVEIDRLLGHGGLFKTKGVAQKLMAGALNVPIDVMETAGEGGPWGMALLAAYRANKAEGESLEDYLAKRVFASAKCETIAPDARDNAGFEAYMNRYIACLPAEKAAGSALK